jgi:hypothetical protein
MRNVLRYVLLNEHKDRAAAGAARNAAPSGAPAVPADRMVGVDHWSSALYFDGFANVGPLPEEPPLEPGTRVVDERGPPVAPARSWLLRVGWRRHGLIYTGEYAPLCSSDA